MIATRQPQRGQGDRKLQPSARTSGSSPRLMREHAARCGVAPKRRVDLVEAWYPCKQEAVNDELIEGVGAESRK